MNDCIYYKFLNNKEYCLKGLINTPCIRNNYLAYYPKIKNK